MRTLAVLVVLIAQAAQPRPAAVLQGHVARAGGGALQDYIDGIDLKPIVK